MSEPKVRVRATARRDIAEIGRWYEEQGGEALAERFILAVRRSLEALAQTPGLGGPADSWRSESAHARRWRVDDFPSYRIFYLPHRDGGISALRVLHTSRDWKRR